MQPTAQRRRWRDQPATCPSAGLGVLLGMVARLVSAHWLLTEKVAFVMECRHFSLNGNMQPAAGRGHQGIPRLDWGQGPGPRQAASAHASSHLPLTRQTPPNMLANHCPPTYPQRTRF